ncbi:MAG: hypothetical protein MMC33_010812 [Icmadophila ericetorum]|nr:hypothetical protein [Icmadophila ericetorum]
MAGVSKSSSSKFEISESDFARFESAFRAYELQCEKPYFAIVKQGILQFEIMLDSSIEMFSTLYTIFDGSYNDRLSADSADVLEYEEIQDDRLYGQFKQVRILERTMDWHFRILLKWDENLKTLRDHVRVLHGEVEFQLKHLGGLETTLQQAPERNIEVQCLEAEYEDESNALWVLERKIDRKIQLVNQLTEVVQKGWEAAKAQDHDVTYFFLKIAEVNKRYKKIVETDEENGQRGGTRAADRELVVEIDSGRLYTREPEDDDIVPPRGRTSPVLFRKARHGYTLSRDAVNKVYCIED